MVAQVKDVADQHFDYIIAGGGTAGLALASRLSEDPDISVAVIEAGQCNFDDPKILVPVQWKLSPIRGNPKYDWNFPVVRQSYAKDKDFSWCRGKGLGGSSAVNIYTWTKPPAGDMDNIEKLGNSGWNWNEFFKYSKLSETFHPASEEFMAIYPHTWSPEHHGTHGPVQTTVPHHVHTIDHMFQDTMAAKGVKYIKDPYGGDITGAWMANSNLDPKSWTRSYAVTAYYLPNRDRMNLTASLSNIVLTEAMVSRVLFADARANEGLIASGVEFIHGGSKHVVHANKEVIISGGTIKSPQILELSGVGRPEVLSKIDVDVKIPLPGVGENVQEHTFVPVNFELSTDVDHQTLDLLREPDFAAETMKLYAEGKGMARCGITSYAYLSLFTANPTEAEALLDQAAKNIESRKKGNLAPGLAEQLDLQLDAFRDKSHPALQFTIVPGFFPAQTTPEPGKRYVSMLGFSDHPLSRGTIHATSTDPLAPPDIDPHYFQDDFDLEILLQHVKFIRSMCETEPWKSGVVREVDPGPEYKTDEQLREYIKNIHCTSYHTAGSCSMLPRDKQGVVDPNLKVYGTANLRVVDLSILPLHLACHTQAIVYMIAEKAADIIRGTTRE